MNVPSVDKPPGSDSVQTLVARIPLTLISVMLTVDNESGSARRTKDHCILQTKGNATNRLLQGMGLVADDYFQYRTHISRENVDKDQVLLERL